MKSIEIKRDEAYIRQEIYNDLSKKARLARLNKGGYVAEKERKRNGFPPLKK